MMSFGKDFIYHFNNASLDALSAPNLQTIVNEIIVSWAMPTKERRDGLSTQLTAALAFRADISLRCYNELSETTFKCDCTHSPSTDYSHHCSSFWIALQAISSQPHIKLKSLILSSSVNDTNAETRLPEMRSLITDKLANLQNLVLCYTHATEYEDLRAFLSCCPTLRRLCLRVRTFKALDGIHFPSLRYLRMGVQRLDEFALRFLNRHTDIEGVHISYFGWDSSCHGGTDNCIKSLRRALMNTCHNIHQESLNQDSKSWGRLS